MKNNRGYTLVELLISLALLAIIMLEIFGVMQNSSKLFSNGTYEVELQTEAQQVIQQMNELMIDASHSISVNYNTTTSSNDITISHNDAIYTVVLTKDNPTDEYGMLYYTKQDLVGGTSTPAPIPMAEYVHSISLNMAEYEKNNFVTLSVSMNNGKYSYVANQAIYLRNEIGSGKNNNYASSGAFDYDLDVLREKQYNLDDIVVKDGVIFSYEWEDASQASVDYDFSGDRNHFIEASTTTNANNDFVGYYTIIAKGNDPEETTVKIRVSSQEVMFGTEGKGILLANTNSSYEYVSAIPIQGVAIEKASGFSVKMSYYDASIGSIQHTGELYGSTSTIPSSWSIFIGGVHFGHNDSANAFDIYSSLFQYNQTQNGYNGYGGYVIGTGVPFCFEVTIDFPHCDDLEGYVYVYPYGLVGNSYWWPTDADDAFWDAVGW